MEAEDLGEREREGDEGRWRAMCDLRCGMYDVRSHSWPVCTAVFRML